MEQLILGLLVWFQLHHPNLEVFLYKNVRPNNVVITSQVEEIGLAWRNGKRFPLYTMRLEEI
jgi:hypothetical protein